MKWANIPQVYLWPGWGLEGLHVPSVKVACLVAVPTILPVSGCSGQCSREWPGCSQGFVRLRRVSPPSDSSCLAPGPLEPGGSQGHPLFGNTPTAHRWVGFFSKGMLCRQLCLLSEGKRGPHTSVGRRERRHAHHRRGALLQAALTSLQHDSLLLTHIVGANENDKMGGLETTLQNQLK